jgi:hypothetical protein
MPIQQPITFNCKLKKAETLDTKRQWSGSKDFRRVERVHQFEPLVARLAGAQRILLGILLSWSVPR